MQKVTRIYALTKNGEKVKAGTLKAVWHFAVDTLGDITAEQFKAQGYKIEPLQVAA